MKWYLKVINQYTDFSGRARRQEYWMFVLLNTVFLIIAGVIDDFINSDFSGNSGIVSLVYNLFVFLPSLAVMVRRFHDVGKSGWYVLVFFGAVFGTSFFSVIMHVSTSIPMILILLASVIWSLIILATDSQPGKNKWGSNPKTGDFDEFDDIGKNVEF